MSVTAKRKNDVFPFLALPNRLLSSIKIAEGDWRTNRKDFVFEFDFVKSPPVLSKYCDLIGAVYILNGMIT